jgi:hypothetical protein
VGDAGELGGQAAAAGPEIEDEVARIDPRFADDLGGKRAGAQEVLARCERRPSARWASA